MRELRDDCAGNGDPFERAADLLFTYLSDVIYNPRAASLDIDALPGAFVNFGKGLEYFSAAVSETRSLAKELAAGNLNCALPPPSNEIASPLKNLHASLKHLTWQTQQVAKGDYSQQVNFMGDFSLSFNKMIEQLRRRNKISLDEKTRLEMYVHLILANSPNPILLFDNQGKLSYMSYSWLRYCKVSEADIVLGMRLNDLFSPFVSEQSMIGIEYLYKRAVEEKLFMETIEEFCFKSGMPSIHFGIQIIPMLDTDGVSNGVMVFLLDLTENVRARNEAERARYLAEQSSLAKTNFLAKMSHEIRTPLNAILGMAELALREELPAAAQEHIRTIKQAGTNLLSIINDILDFSKIESGKVEVIPEEYSFAVLANDVVNIIKTKALESRLRFAVNIDGGIPGIMFGDQLRIRQVLLNILSNAVKYTEKGFVSLSIEGKIKDNDTVILTIDVTDSGRGIKQEETGRLFEEFERLEPESNRTIEGTGLGLAIAKRLINAMNGGINVKSEYGKGSTFTITLPQVIRGREKLVSVDNPGGKKVLLYERRELCANSIIQTMENLGVVCNLVSSASGFYDEISGGGYSFIFIASALYDEIRKSYSHLNTGAKIVLIAEFGEALTYRNVSILTTPVFSIPVAKILNGSPGAFPGEASKKPAANFTAPGANIMVVDDIITNLKVIEGLLLPYMAYVKSCRNGQEAIEEIKSTRYDLVLMDHMMPVMDGIETVSRIRALGAYSSYYKTVPIIALTANAVSGTREMFLNNGFDDFLSKPVDSLKLNYILQRWIPNEKIKSPVRENGVNTGPANEGKILYINGLNTEKGIAMSGGTIKNYLKILSVFYEDGMEKIREIGAALETGNIALYTIYTHALKSASANIGAEEISTAAKALEEAGKQGNISFINTHNPVFLNELGRLLGNIKAAAAEETWRKQNKPEDIEALTHWLRRLKDALNAFDSAAIISAARALEEFTNAPGFGEEIRNILQNRLIGEYDTTVLLIDRLLEKLS